MAHNVLGRSAAATTTLKYISLDDGTESGSIDVVVQDADANELVGCASLDLGGLRNRDLGTSVGIPTGTPSDLGAAAKAPTMRPDARPSFAMAEDWGEVNAGRQ